MARRRARVKPLWVADGDCWIWQGVRTGSGYPRWTKRKRGQPARAAHRVLYEQARRAIPRGFQLDHLCGVILCVRPSHMQPVPQRVNRRRQTIRARRRR
jgi:hypothetical protein